MESKDLNFLSSEGFADKANILVTDTKLIKEASQIAMSSFGYSIGSVLPLGEHSFNCVGVRFKNRIKADNSKQTLCFVVVDYDGRQIDVLQASNMVGMVSAGEPVTFNTQPPTGNQIGNQSSLVINAAPKATLEPTLTFDILRNKYKDDAKNLEKLEKMVLRGDTPKEIQELLAL